LPDHDEGSRLLEPWQRVTPTEAWHLRIIIQQTSRPESTDPKLGVAILTPEASTEGKHRLQPGCILFSQYRDTAFWIATQLAAALGEGPWRSMPRAARAGCSNGTLDIIGGLPDTIEDDWIESEERLNQIVNQYVYLRAKSCDAFGVRYKGGIDHDKNR
jgi:hypothetical protein